MYVATASPRPKRSAFDSSRGGNVPCVPPPLDPPLLRSRNPDHGGVVYQIPCVSYALKCTLIRLDAHSRVGAHLSKLDPIQDIGPKIGLGISLRVVSLFGETVVLTSVCSCTVKMISA